MNIIHPSVPRQYVILSILLLIASLAPLAGAPDLDVCFISRTPAFNRYNVTYTYGVNPSDPNTCVPSLTPTEQARQRWPNSGQLITFTATIKNPGNAATGSFAYKWYFDGNVVKTGTLSSLAPGGQTTTTYTWNWDSEWITHKIKFVVDPDNLIAEDIETNNWVEDPTNALYFSMYVWQDLYDWFRTEAR